MSVTIYNHEKMYTYIKGFATGAGMKETLKALSYPDGGDGIKLIDWLAERGTYYPVRLHTMNPVGRENMQRTIDRYWP